MLTAHHQNTFLPLSYTSFFTVLRRFKKHQITTEHVMRRVAEVRTLTDAALSAWLACSTVSDGQQRTYASQPFYSLLTDTHTCFPP